MTTFQEPARAVPVVDETDLLIAGGGPAGTLAAIAAARWGARVRLIESQGALGGIWTTGCLPHIIEAQKGGLLAELLDRLEMAGAGRRAPSLDGARSYDYDVETFKVVLEAMAAEAGVAVRLYTRVSAVYRDDTGRLDTVVTDSKSGREAWRATLFLDSTGDGDLAAQAGCGFEIGQPGIHLIAADTNDAVMGK
jgi:flavin-dependent dehydrogenase